LPISHRKNFLPARSQVEVSQVGRGNGPREEWSRIAIFSGLFCKMSSENQPTFQDSELEFFLTPPPPRTPGGTGGGGGGRPPPGPGGGGGVVNACPPGKKSVGPPPPG